MNSLIVACGYYQYNMLNINNLFQNGIIMILIPLNCTKYLFCAIITQKLSYVNNLIKHFLPSNSDDTL